MVQLVAATLLWVYLTLLPSFYPRKSAGSSHSLLDRVDADAPTENTSRRSTLGSYESPVSRGRVYINHSFP